MQLAAHIIAYDVNRYINPMLRNVAPWVDKIYIAYSRRPWGYIPASREQRENPTKLSDINLEGLDCPVEIIHGDWMKDEDTRNACLEKARSEGFDWLITQDADEFYPESCWEQLRLALEEDRDSDCIITTWYTFWKSSDYVLFFRDGSIKGTNAGFALRCNSDVRFKVSRTCSSEKVKIIDAPCYHYGYVKSDQEMYDKVTQWSHAHQFDGERWFNIKWKNWDLFTRNIGMSDPLSWKQAIRFPLHQPNFAAHFRMPVNSVVMTKEDRIRESLYDFRANTHDVLKRVKRLAI